MIKTDILKNESSKLKVRPGEVVFLKTEIYDDEEIEKARLKALEDYNKTHENFDLKTKALVVGNKIYKQVSEIDDCKLLKQLLFERGFDLSLQECEELWETVSEQVSASWLNVSERNVNEYLFNDEEEVIY